MATVSSSLAYTVAHLANAVSPSIERDVDRAPSLTSKFFSTLCSHL